jgi:NADH-quinone oxidoreductase subunit I
MRILVSSIADIALGIWHLMQGMYISMLNLLRPKITEQYPENRKRRKDFERFRGMLVMPHSTENKHRCTACGICAMNCPNKSIAITIKKAADNTGKEKRMLAAYSYDLGRCTFCGLCTQVCPQNAIKWTTAFEHAVFTRTKLTMQLNHEGSCLEER